MFLLIQKGAGASLGTVRWEPASKKIGFYGREAPGTHTSYIFSSAANPRFTKNTVNGGEKSEIVELNTVLCVYFLSPECILKRNGKQ